MGWRETQEPAVGVQLEWNKTLFAKFNQISSEISKISLRGGADTITMYPALEGLLHPDFYDNHRKILLGGYNLVFDENMDKYAIELKNVRALENLQLIPDLTKDGEINMKRVEDCSEEQVVNYIEGLVGYVIIENLTVN